MKTFNGCNKGIFSLVKKKTSLESYAAVRFTSKDAADIVEKTLFNVSRGYFWVCKNISV